MKNRTIAIIIVLIILISIGTSIGYVAYTGQQYKTIHMSGFSLDVPDNNIKVISNSNNFNTYYDTINNITILTLSCNATSVEDINGGLIITQNILKHDSLNELKYQRFTLKNSSGTYCYFDNSTGSWIYIESKDLHLIISIISSLSKPDNGTMNDKVIDNYNNGKKNQEQFKKNENLSAWVTYKGVHFHLHEGKYPYYNQHEDRIFYSREEEFESVKQHIDMRING